MATTTTTFRDGWPVMAPLGRREQALLAAQLDDDESVLGQVIGTFSQAVVATDRHVLVLKAGFTSGQAFGGRATSFDYDGITGIELRARIAQGEFEILTATSAVNAWDTRRINLAEQPNGVVFSKLDRDAFTAMAEKIREHAGLANTAP
jgi:hypothetical protein